MEQWEIHIRGLIFTLNLMPPGFIVYPQCLTENRTEHQCLRLSSPWSYPLKLKFSHSTSYLLSSAFSLSLPPPLHFLNHHSVNSLPNCYQKKHVNCTAKPKLCWLFLCEGIMFHQCAPKGQNINQHFYAAIFSHIQSSVIEISIHTHQIRLPVTLFLERPMILWCTSSCTQCSGTAICNFKNWVSEVILALEGTVGQVCMCWRSLPWRWLTSHPCKDSNFIFTDSVSVLFDQVAYRGDGVPCCVLH